MTTKEVNGYYGTHNEATIFVYENRNGSRWYCVEGSTNVNKTFDEIEEGVNVETLQDVDFFTASKPVNDIDQLVEEVES